MSQIQVELQEWMGSDRSIAEAAWTSSITLQGKEKRSDEDTARVVKMLIQSKHASPIESIVMRFWIKMPIAIDRQHMTHRIASHNGMSGRYRTMPNEFFSMPDDVKNITNKALTNLFGSKPQSDRVIERYNTLCHEANYHYEMIVKQFKEAEKINLITNDEFKRAREFYRGILPQHNMTERVTVMNLRSFANYQKLRNSNHAQHEIHEVANLMLNEVIEKNICPIAIQCLRDVKWEI